ncbi:hypothetical protein DSO57_1034287 [Entomophthora muscae]|uniref:Uncharacterized protein n=1 Tax=Entomophthora muscae TaxID=34485 RepID=A0ACC2TAR1_9FUNG|nr:hypothetical protein DSO57_1034287 [Entomophthora muscae]
MSFNSLNTTHSIEVYNSSMDAILGLAPVALESLTISKCTKLWNFSLKSLKHAKTISLSSLTIVDLKSHLSGSLNISECLSLKKLRFHDVNIGFSIFPGTLALESNHNLCEIKFHCQEYLAAPVIKIDNNKLHTITFYGMQLDFSPPQHVKGKHPYFNSNPLAYLSSTQSDTQSIEGALRSTVSDQFTDKNAEGSPEGVDQKLNPALKNYLKVYIFICIPLSLLGLILLVLYLK